MRHTALLSDGFSYDPEYQIPLDSLAIINYQHVKINEKLHKKTRQSAGFEIQHRNYSASAAVSSATGATSSVATSSARTSVPADDTEFPVAAVVIIVLLVCILGSDFLKSLYWKISWRLRKK